VTNVKFWIGRFAIAMGVAFVVIAGAQMLKGNSLEYAVVQGLLWSIVAAAVFTMTGVYRWRRGERCAVCGDPPEAASAGTEHRAAQASERDRR